MKDHRQGVTRRVLLKRTTVFSLVLAAPALRRAVVHAQAELPPCASHGAPMRGVDLPAKNRSAEGRFGLMFKRLPAFAPPDELLTALGQQMEEQPREPFDQNDEVNGNPNPKLSAGFTFLGQFIDHDITLDNTPLSLQEADPLATRNFRTPRYDLDSLYGKGPAEQPEFYDPNDRDKLLIVLNSYGVSDAARTTDGSALIPDCRNDQNLITMQLHLAFMKFHNRLVDYLRGQGTRPEEVFETARRLARWHYQWMVIHDFLPAIVGEELVGPNGDVYREQAGKRPTINLKYYKPNNKRDLPFMPVEFAVAAYRFGHSMARPRYAPNLTTGFIPLFEQEPGLNLNGKRPISPELVIDWRIFFPVAPDPALQLPRQPRRIDSRLSFPLFNLPASVVPPPDPQTLLAVRNLLRGKRLTLPSGQEVANAMRISPLSNEELANKLTYYPPTETSAGKEVIEYDPLVGPLITDAGWKGQAPLWFYILREAELLHGGRRLGPVGGRIVAEVLVGLLKRDRNSYLYGAPPWQPAPPIAPAVGQFTMADLLKFAGAA